MKYKWISYNLNRNLSDLRFSFFRDKLQHCVCCYYYFLPSMNLFPQHVTIISVSVVLIGEMVKRKLLPQLELSLLPAARLRRRIWEDHSVGRGQWDSSL